MMLEILYISLRFVNHNLTAFQFCNGYWTGTCTLQGKACYITIGRWMYSWIKIRIRYIIFVFIFIFAGYCIRGSPIHLFFTNMLGKHIYFLQAKTNKYGCGDWTNNWSLWLKTNWFHIEVEFAEISLIANPWYAPCCWGWKPNCQLGCCPHSSGLMEERRNI